MTQAAKSLCLLLLVIAGVGATKRLPFRLAPQLPAVVVPPPSTNTYGLQIAWTIVDQFVQYTRIYWGKNPGPPWLGTNDVPNRQETTTLRLPMTNDLYWIAATSADPNMGESDPIFLTRTNYAHFALIDTGSGAEVAGTTLVNPTQQVQLFKAIGITSNNWVKLP